MEGLRARRPLKNIADDLGVSIGSISVQQARAQRKLHTNNRVDALRRWERIRERYVSESTSENLTR